MHLYKDVKILCCLILCNGSVVSLAEEGAPVVVESINASMVLPVPKISRGVFLIEHEHGSGSGFLMQEKGTVYFVSNIHVIEGGENFSIRNVYGETVTVPQQVEVASDRDLIRFPVASYEIGFLLSKEFDFGDNVCALGNSGGGGVITRLDGKILAMGPGLVEVSSKFIPGNSGGPVVDQNNQVVGVSTYVKRTTGIPDWLLEGSRFEGSRRMAVRVDNVKWISMEWDDFCREAACVQNMETYSDAVIHIVNSLSENGYELIYSEVDHSGLQKWLRQHNQDVRKAGSRMDRVETGSKIKYVVSSSMRRAVRSNFASLGEVMKGLENEASRTSRLSLPFFKERMERYQRYFNSCRIQMETIVETMF